MKPICLRWRQLMLADLDNTLDTDARSGLERHLQACAECRGQRHSLLAARTATAPLRRQSASEPVPEALATVVKARVAETAAGQAATNRAGQAVRAFPDRAETGNSHIGRQGIALRYASAFATVILIIALIVVYRSVSQSIELTSGSAAGFGAPTAAATAGNQSQEAELGADRSGILATGNPGAPVTAAGSGYIAKSASESVPEANAPVTNGTRSAGVASSGVDASGSAGSAGTVAMNAAVPGYRLYTGNLTDLGKLISDAPEYRLPPHLLTEAASLRILASPADAAVPVRQIIVLAGYPAAEAIKLADQFRAAMPGSSNRVTIETIIPESQARLSAIFGETLLAQLLPTEKERQLTYIMITIGG